MNQCPCGSARVYDDCCGPVIHGAIRAPTAEALMRSRYSAFVKGEIEYLRDSLHPSQRADFDPAATRKWAEDSEWLRLEIVNTSGGGEDDRDGTVEFIASFRQKGKPFAHHEIAQFNRENDIWYYTDGKMVTAGTIRHEAPRVGRNDPCPCGSGKKYKKCCGT